jgi:hypothetical protein
VDKQTGLREVMLGRNWTVRRQAMAIWLLAVCGGFAMLAMGAAHGESSGGWFAGAIALGGISGCIRGLARQLPT